VDQARPDGAALLPGVSRMWMPILDRTRTSKDERVRWKSSGIPLSGEKLSGGRAMEVEATSITVVGMLLILAVVVLLGLFFDALFNQRESASGSSSANGV
jgi:hypothetical protein